MIVLINTLAILMISAQMATAEVLKINVFWNKSFDVIISVHNATIKILSRDSNYTVDVIMWSKFDQTLEFVWEKLW